MDLLRVRLGFGFSAGLFDYVLNYGLATRPLWLLPVGAVYFLIYYSVFRACIVAFNLQTPGREAPENEPAATFVPVAAAARGAAFLQALGGSRNLKSVDACATRLRLTVADQHAINERALKDLGARATVKVSSDGLQVVLGPIADQVAGEIREQMRAVPSNAGSGLLAALGGRENVRDVELIASSRLRVSLANVNAIDEAAMRAMGVRAIARPERDRVHLIIGPSANETLAALRGLIAT
jgi:PTS system N-acetylglucosamine-specific IIC component